MTIQYAILGLLSWKPLSGYDLKKLIADSAIFYWSGNNNQIYKGLIELHEAGLVTRETFQQESLPARHVYTITAEGQAALKKWVLSAPELPEFRSTFLVQLSWADVLDGAELDGLLANYEEELRVQVLMQQEKASRAEPAPGRTAREDYLWKMISRNAAAAYEHELDWVCELRQGLKHL